MEQFLSLGSSKVAPSSLFFPHVGEELPVILHARRAEEGVLVSGASHDGKPVGGSSWEEHCFRGELVSSVQTWPGLLLG